MRSALGLLGVAMLLAAGVKYLLPMFIRQFSPVGLWVTILTPTLLIALILVRRMG